jgi:alcohol dehydrogenase
MTHHDATTSPHIASFDHQPRTRLVYGVNAVDRVGELSKELGARKVLLVTDPGLVAAGHAGHVQGILEKSGLVVTVFDKALENPTTRCVDQCVTVAKRADIDTIVGLGGGSSMDTAKGCNFILTNGGRMQDYWGQGKAQQPMLPLIAIPTTAGTGSECQSFALIADEQTHQKMACGDPKAAARIALLDPALTVSQPKRVTTCTGVDAITHAIETAVTKKRNPLSLMYSHQAFKLCVSSMAQVLKHPKDIEARGRMLLGAAFAGMAIENSMLGAAHSAANPLTAHYDVVHGHAVGIMLPLVVRFNAKDPAALEAYAELASSLELARKSDGLNSALEALLSRLSSILNLAGIPRSLSECGVEPSKINVLAEEASKQWTAAFNPRPVTVADFVAMYEGAFERRSDGDLV